MVAPALLDQIRNAVDANFEDQVEFLATVVRFPSIRGQEAPLQDFLARRFSERGYAVDRYTLDEVPLSSHPKASPVADTDYSRAVQVVAAHRPASPKGRSLILQGHVDVVPPGPAEMWTYPPFSATIKDGWMYGRGAHDMKSGVVANIYALDALRRAGFVPDADVYLQSVTEEECTGNGALSTLMRGYRADACLIPESTDRKLWRSHTGTLWFRLRVRGMPVHASITQSGSNAIFSAFRISQALLKHTAELNKAAPSHPWYKDVPEPIKFNVGVIKGGDWTGSTPAWCDMDCRISILPGDSVAEARRGVERCVAEAAGQDPFLAQFPPEFIWHGHTSDPYVLEPGSDAEAALAAAHLQVFGQPLETICTTAMADTRFYGLYYGIPALCYGNIGEGAHAFDERTNLAALRQTTLSIATFVAEWCGLRSITDGAL
ncbi:MAG: acetylornithine deacetylase or succinyl-diaminopimelate desuccinylase [Roseomonas sp.]|nr:acetylornithine deacetylase or succinyl-diaminopimelate desuccinylase [Roseomonas sp.]